MRHNRAHVSSYLERREIGTEKEAGKRAETGPWRQEQWKREREKGERREREMEGEQGPPRRKERGECAQVQLSGPQGQASQMPEY